MGFSFEDLCKDSQECILYRERIKNCMKYVVVIFIIFKNLPTLE